jgi:hypothetical protein
MQIQKNIVFIVLFIIIGIIGVLVIFQNEPTKQEPEIKLQETIELKYLDRVNFGTQKGIFVYLQAKNELEPKNRTIKLFFYNKEPIKKVYLIKGIFAGAKKYSEFKEVLKKTAKNYALELEEIDLLDIDKQEDAIYILPSGVWPAKLNKDINKIITENSLFFYLGTNENISITESGQIQRGGLNLIILNSTKKIDYFFEKGLEAYENEKDINDQIKKPNFIIIKQTVDQIRDYEIFSKDLIEYSIAKEQETKIFTNNFQTTYYNAFEGLENYSWARVVVYYKDNPEYNWLKAIKNYVGQVYGPKNTNSSIASIQIILSMPENQKFNLYAQVLTDELEQYSIQKIGTYNDTQGQIWVGSIPDLKLPNSRYALIRIIDQYKRVYAFGVIKTNKYEISLKNARGEMREYCIKKDSEDYILDSIYVKKEGSDWIKIPVVSSCFAVRSNWKEGLNTIYFKIEDREFKEEWTEQPSRWRVFIEIGLPFALIFGIWYLFFRRERRNIFYLQIPEYLPIEHTDLEISKKDILGFINQIRSFEEIKKMIHEKLKNESKYVPTNESIENALIELVNKGELLKLQNYYGPKDMKKEEFEYNVILNILKEHLKQQGLVLDKDLIDNKKRRWAIVLDEKDLNLKKMADFAVFLNSEKKEEFEKKIANSLKPEHIKIKIAMLTKKLKLLSIDELKKERI